MSEVILENVRKKNDFQFFKLIIVTNFLSKMVAVIIPLHLKIMNGNLNSKWFHFIKYCPNYAWDKSVTYLIKWLWPLQRIDGSFSSIWVILISIQSLFNLACRYRSNYLVCQIKFRENCLSTYLNLVSGFI